MTEHLLIGLAWIVLLGVGSQWLAWRLRLPSILLLLLSGFIAGPILGLVNPDELLGDLLFPIVSLSVAVILFEGGLTLRLAELPQVGRVIARLISVGAGITWLAAALAAHFILGLDWPLSVLLGAILIVTGPTVISPLLRQIRPQGQVGPALKWEGILIDPVGAVLAVLVFEAILAGEFEQAPGVIASGVLETALIGLVVGIAGAVIIHFFLTRYLIPDHLQIGVTLLFVVVAFAFSNELHPEAGLVTVTLMGLILANQSEIAIRHIVEFKENLQVLLIGTLFIILSARISPEQLLDAGWQSLLFLAVLILIVRPLAVLVSTWKLSFSWRERLFMAWMAPRGIVAAAVASLFAFELVEAGHEGAEQLVTQTFIVIVGTVSFYGLTAGLLARRLGLAEQEPQGVLFVGAHALARDMACVLAEHGFAARLLDTNWQNIQAARMEDLDVYYGDALSEEVMEEMDFSGLGRLLAMTSNNDVNSLASIHYPEVFSRAEVYQLPLPTGHHHSGRVRDIRMELTGRFLFAEDMSYDHLMLHYQEGYEVKATQLTEEFDYTAFQQRQQGNAIPLFLITSRGQLQIYTTDKQPEPRPGQTIISLAPPG